MCKKYHVNYAEATFGAVQYFMSDIAFETSGVSGKLSSSHVSNRYKIVI